MHPLPRPVPPLETPRHALYHGAAPDASADKDASSWRHPRRCESQGQPTDTRKPPQLYLFEPDPGQCARLAAAHADAGPRARILCHGLAAAEGTAVLDSATGALHARVDMGVVLARWIIKTRDVMKTQ